MLILSILSIVIELIKIILFLLREGLIVPLYNYVDFKGGNEMICDKHCTRDHRDCIMIFFPILLFDYLGSITNVNYSIFINCYRMLSILSIDYPGNKDTAYKRVGAERMAYAYCILLTISTAIFELP